MYNTFIMFYIVGIGNPGEEYAETRHNIGMMALERFIKDNDLGDPITTKKIPALISEGSIKKEKFTLIFPQTFVNKSGSAVSSLITSAKKAEQLIVVHDDLDLPLGKIKIIFNRGSGGHKGVESIVRALKTEAFVRIRVGICPTTPTGKLKKPDHKKMLDFIVGEFKPNEMVIVKKTIKTVSEAIKRLIEEDRSIAMNEFN
jgi:peptidyl-tRNA hydrolase, PTH1 family